MDYQCNKGCNKSSFLNPLKLYLLVAYSLISIPAASTNYRKPPVYAGVFFFKRLVKKLYHI